MKEGKKALVVYYSLEGNCDFIAKEIKNNIDADLLRIEPLKSINPKGFSKYIWGGTQVFMKKKPELSSFKVNMEDYDALFIGTPVWAWTFAPPLASFFESVEIKRKKIAIFACHEGQLGKTFDKLQKALVNGNNEFIGQIDFFNPLKKDTAGAKEKLKLWSLDIAESKLS